jgi:hypothetical protein
MAKRLDADERAESECRRERLQMELRLVEAELRSDEALRLQDRVRPVGERPRLSGGWRDWVK